MTTNQRGSNLQAVVLDKDDGSFLGCAGIHNIDTGTPEFGIWIKKSAHGNSYGKEAIIALKKWADENLDYEYLLYPVTEENYASRRIPEFLGGIVVREYDETNMSGNLQHILEYRIYPDGT
jgi:RimJ/RimL family protein N-acetyltransferase